MRALYAVRIAFNSTYWFTRLSLSIIFSRIVTSQAAGRRLRYVKVDLV